MGGHIFFLHHILLLLATLTIDVSSILRAHPYRSAMSMTVSGPAQNVVILGAGIHGASVAYYLSTRFGILPTVVERTNVGAAASGKAGGFLAREWGSGSTKQLHQVSFDMHETLGEMIAAAVKHILYDWFRY